jgi:putative redox protein
MPSERAVELKWTGTGMLFEGRGTQPVTPGIVVDGDGKEGPSPMITMLLAAASCSASDVVMILEKMRVRLRRCDVDVRGVRRDEEPRRYIAVRYRFTLAGDGLDQAKAERAVDLSLTKYCSVIASLAPDIAIEHEIVLA